MKRMKRISTLLSLGAGLATLPGVVQAQGTSGTGTFGGTVPTTFSIANITNGSLVTALGTFNTLTIGQNVLSSPTPLAFRVRSKVDLAPNPTAPAEQTGERAGEL